jgi:hypothetical protein
MSEKPRASWGSNNKALDNLAGEVRELLWDLKFSPFGEEEVFTVTIFPPDLKRIAEEEDLADVTEMAAALTHGRFKNITDLEVERIRCSHLEDPPQGCRIGWRIREG